MADDPVIRQAELLAELLGENEQTAARLLRAYAKIYRDLTAEWQTVIDEIEQARAEGRDLGLLTFKSQRVAELRLQTARTIDAFSTEAERLVIGEQKKAALAGQEHAREVTLVALQSVAPEERISFAILPNRAIQGMVGRFSNGMPLTALFRTLGTEAAQQAQDVLVRGLALGMHPYQAARKIRDALGVPLSRARTISRTEMLGVYRDSTLSAYRLNDELVQAWRWNATLDERTCMSCVALHGTIHPLEEMMDEHVNGRCAPSPVLIPNGDLGDIQEKLRRQLERGQTGPDYWDSLSADEQRRRLGPGKFALMEAGQIDLQDMVYADSNPIWGRQYREASIQQALWHHSLGTERFTYEVGGD